MSGRKIDDHSFWAGAKSKDSVFPKGAHSKDERESDGAGEMHDYEDTTEMIHSAQEMNKAKAMKHKQKTHHRN